MNPYLRIFGRILLLVCCSPYMSHAQVTKLSPALRETLLHARPVSLVTKAAEIPKEVSRACAEAAGEKEFTIVDASAPFYADMPTPPRGAPTRRLNWLARLEHMYLLHYQTRGKKGNYHLVVLLAQPPDSEHAVIMWRAMVAKHQSLDNYDDFLRVLSKNALSDANIFVE